MFYNHDHHGRVDMRSAHASCPSFHQKWIVQAHFFVLSCFGHTLCAKRMLLTMRSNENHNPGYGRGFPRLISIPRHFPAAGCLHACLRTRLHTCYTWRRTCQHTGPNTYRCTRLFTHLHTWSGTFLIINKS